MKKIFTKIIEEDGVNKYKMKKNSSNISVVIRTKNEERWIGHAIQSIIDNLRQSEIIIVDNNSTDETLNIVKSFIADPLLNNNPNSNYTKIRIFKIKDYSPGKFLNFGVKKAKFNNLMILSAHCVIKKINVKNIKENLNSK